jgi:hypothetical protein
MDCGNRRRGEPVREPECVHDFLQMLAIFLIPAAPRRADARLADHVLDRVPDSAGADGRALPRDRRLRADRPAVLGAGPLLKSAVGHGADAGQRLEPGAAGCVARATGLSRERVQALVDCRTEEPLFGFLGEARVNVLLLNLDVDAARGRWMGCHPARSRRIHGGDGAAPPPWIPRLRAE